LTARAVFAARLRDAGKTAIAAAEIDKILALVPGYIVARVDHMCLAIDDRRFIEARDDLDQILDDPRLAEYVVSTSQRGWTLLDASRRFARNGEFREAIKLAKKTVELMKETGGPLGRAYYTLAQIESLAARTDPRWIADAAKQLRQAIRANIDYEQWFLQDEAFAPVRLPIRAKLDAMGP
jgi:tetratricopeptide (TPR) repeat protein